MGQSSGAKTRASRRAVPRRISRAHGAWAVSAQVFNGRQGPILIEAQATGPAGTVDLNLVLDTGATTSLIDFGIILHLGFDPNQPLQRARMTTGSAVGIAPVFALTRFSALGHHRFVFPVIAHSLSSASNVDGLLGLDFLRNQALTIDFRAGQIDLS
jgi:hypothetical protein